MSPEAIILADQYGGLYKEHPDYPIDLWVDAVNNDNTRDGYWDWVLINIQADTGINPVNLHEDIPQDMDEQLMEDDDDASPPPRAAMAVLDQMTDPNTTPEEAKELFAQMIGKSVTKPSGSDDF